MRGREGEGERGEEEEEEKGCYSSRERGMEVQKFMDEGEVEIEPVLFPFLSLSACSCFPRCWGREHSGFKDQRRVIAHVPITGHCYLPDSIIALSISLSLQTYCPSPAPLEWLLSSKRRSKVGAQLFGQLTPLSGKHQSNAKRKGKGKGGSWGSRRGRKSRGWKEKLQ